MDRCMAVSDMIKFKGRKKEMKKENGNRYKHEAELWQKDR